MTSTLLKKILWVLFISMLPVIELRGAIPVAAIADLDWRIAYILCVVGNMIPVPFILLFIRKMLEWMRTKPKLEKFAGWIENRAMKRSAFIRRFETIGLIIFVAVPIPGTGAWTGSIIAALLEMRMKDALPALFIGVLIAGVFVTGIAYGFISLF